MMSRVFKNASTGNARVILERHDKVSQRRRRDERERKTHLWVHREERRKQEEKEQALGGILIALAEESSPGSLLIQTGPKDRRKHEDRTERGAVLQGGPPGVSARACAARCFPSVLAKNGDEQLAVGPFASQTEQIGIVPPASTISVGAKQVIARSGFVQSRPPPP